MENNKRSKKRQSSDTEACTKRHYEITVKDLPLSCPPRGTRVWDAHPRVYFPIAETGKYLCPYCSAEYVLKDFTPELSELLQDDNK